MADHTGIRHVAVSENIVELFGEDALFFFNQTPSKNVATSAGANSIKNIF